jgi:hypothetical protein
MAQCRATHEQLERGVQTTSTSGAQQTECIPQADMIHMHSTAERMEKKKKMQEK